MAKKKTPEEEKREQEGNAFIQQREQTASKLGLEGKRGIEAASSIVSEQENRQRTVQEARQRTGEVGERVQGVKDIVAGQGINQAVIDAQNKVPDNALALNPNVPAVLTGTAREVIGEATSQPLLKTVGEVIGVVKDFTSLLVGGEGKGLDQKTAEENFASAKQIISQDIALVKAGLKDPFDARLGFESALAENKKLLGATHGFNRLNVRYFTQQGKDVETMVLQNQNFLENALLELELAAQQGAVAQATAQQGESGNNGT